MPTKQIKLRFQVSSDNDTTANVVVTTNGTQVFSGALAQTTAAIVPFDVHYYSDPYQEVTFNVDVPAFSNATPLTEQFTNIAAEITCSGGNIALQAALSNWTPTFTETANVFQFVPGTADNYVLMDIPEAPLFDGVVNLNLYNISENYSITGPGAVVIVQPTVATVVHGVQPYSS